MLDWLFGVSHHPQHIWRDAPQWAIDLHRQNVLILDALETIMATMEELNAAVARNTDAEASVVALLKGISQQLKDARAANDPAAIDAVIAKIDANTAAAAAAVVENTV